MRLFTVVIISFWLLACNGGQDIQKSAVKVTKQEKQGAYKPSAPINAQVVATDIRLRESSSVEVSILAPSNSPITVELMTIKDIAVHQDSQLVKTDSVGSAVVKLFFTPYKEGKQYLPLHISVIDKEKQQEKFSRVVELPVIVAGH